MAWLKIYPRCFARQKRLRLAKVAAADKRQRRAQRRQRRGVVGAQHQVAPVGRDQRPLGLRVRAPEHKNHRLRAWRTLGNMAQHGIGQQLPALAGVAGGLAFFHRQAGVEQQYALLRPRL